MLDYSVQLGCYMGCPYPRDEQDEVEGQEKLTRSRLGLVGLFTILPVKRVTIT